MNYIQRCVYTCFLVLLCFSFSSGGRLLLDSIYIPDGQVVKKAPSMMHQMMNNDNHEVKPPPKAMSQMMNNDDHEVKPPPRPMTWMMNNDEHEVKLPPKPMTQMNDNLNYHGIELERPMNIDNPGGQMMDKYNTNGEGDDKEKIDGQRMNNYNTNGDDKEKIDGEGDRKEKIDGQRMNNDNPGGQGMNNNNPDGYVVKPPPRSMPHMNNEANIIESGGNMKIMEKELKLIPQMDYDYDDNTDMIGPKQPMTSQDDKSHADEPKPSFNSGITEEKAGFGYGIGYGGQGGSGIGIGYGSGGGGTGIGIGIGYGPGGAVSCQQQGTCCQTGSCSPPYAPILPPPVPPPYLPVPVPPTPPRPIPPPPYLPVPVPPAPIYPPPCPTCSPTAPIPFPPFPPLPPLPPFPFPPLPPVPPPPSIVPCPPGTLETEKIQRNEVQDAMPPMSDDLMDELTLSSMEPDGMKDALIPASSFDPYNMLNDELISFSSMDSDDDMMEDETFP